MSFFSGMVVHKERKNRTITPTEPKKAGSECSLDGTVTSGRPGIPMKPCPSSSKSSESSDPHVVSYRIDLSEVPELDHSNWICWKERIMNVLVVAGLREALDATEDGPAGMKRSMIARGAIMQTLRSEDLLV